MKRISIRNTAAIFFAGLMFLSCANQRKVAAETDDIYYSSEDRAKTENNEFTQAKQANGADYKASDATSESEYFSVGKEKQSSDANARAQGAYSSQESSETPANADNSNGVTNNYYGTTNYYDEDYYDDSYATQIRRFNNVNLGLSYGFYDPFFTTAYWNYGWGYYNPYPYSGWHVGYNSWTGWNVGYGFGWGNGCWGYNNWGHPYGFGGIWGHPMYGYGNYGWGSPYYGMNNAYWNGYYDGYFNGNYAETNNGRPVISGRRSTINNRSFNGSVPPSRGNSANPTGKNTDGSGQIANNSIGSARSVSERTNATVQNSPANDRTGALDKFSRTNSIYQVSGAKSDINTRAQVAGVRYGDNKPIVVDDRSASIQKADYTAAQTKYNSGSLVNTAANDRSNASTTRESAVQSQSAAEVRKTNAQSTYSGSSRISTEQRPVNVRNTTQSPAQNTRSGDVNTTRSGQPEQRTTQDRYNRPTSTRPASGNYQPSQNPGSRSNTVSPSQQDYRPATRSGGAERSNNYTPSRSGSSSGNSRSGGYTPSSGSSSGRSGGMSAPSRSSSPTGGGSSSRSSGGRR